MQLRLALVVAGILMLSGLRQASAQNPGQFYQSPTTSPYLNLLNDNTSGISNYQTLVRPQLDGREAILRNTVGLQRLQQQFQQSQSATARGTNGTTRSSGHQTRFMNYSHFYGPSH
jgi:hypothetical protein